MIDGNINADWVIIDEKAYVKGDIVAQGGIISGKIEGNIRARELVEVQSKGVITGDVFTSKLSIIEGGILNGRISMQGDATKVIDLQQKEK